MPEMFLFMVLRILMMVMAAQPVIGMPPGEVVAVFKKIHAPDGIALPVTFMLRFFPTVRSEFSDVFASLRLRKLLSWKHPLDAMEYIVTPVIFRSSRIAEELAASAESRGISNPGKHTCRRKIEFQKRDWIMCVVAVCVTALLFVLERDGSIMVNDKARRSVIQFEDVSFEYPGAETESIHHISPRYKKGRVPLF